MILWLFILPALAGIAAFFVKDYRTTRFLLPTATFGHLALTFFCAWRRPPELLGGWIGLDPLGALFLCIVAVLFSVSSIHLIDYLRRETALKIHGPIPGSEQVFAGCYLLFLASMTLVTVSRHLGLLWVAIEATTLASAPLIYFHRDRRSLEAAWKYLLICSVGIALALLGNLFMALAGSNSTGDSVPMRIDDLVNHAASLNQPWLKAAFVFFLVGYGAKMGLAPMHTWLPDAHSEAPSPVSAMLSGALLNCAFLGILRGRQVLGAGGLGPFADGLLVAVGLFSMAIAAAFIVRQTDFKRMLAYSSVEHMGILSLGTGLGGGALFGSMLHAVNHSLAKATLFMVAGNILAACRTKQIHLVRGLFALRPASAVLWIAGLFAITGSPPFGLFISEFAILRAAIAQGRPGIAILYLLLLAIVFVAMAAAMLTMAQGRPPEGIAKLKESRPAVWPPAVFAAMVLVLGLYIPPFLRHALDAAVRVLEGQSW